MSIEPGKAFNAITEDNVLGNQLREMNEELIISLLRQHEMAEKAEKASLRVSEERFRVAIEESPIPVVMLAEDGEILVISRTWTKLTGYPNEDTSVIHSWLTKAYGFGGGEHVRDAVQQSFLPPSYEGPMRGVVFDITTREGELRTLSFNASTPGVLADGRRYVICMAEDVTDRVKAEKELHKKGREDAAKRALDRYGRIPDRAQGHRHGRTAARLPRADQWRPQSVVAPWALMFVAVGDEEDYKALTAI